MKEITITLKPTERDLAEIIWGMDSVEQVNLLRLMAECFNTTEGLHQLAFISDSLQKSCYVEDVRKFVSNLYEYVMEKE